MTKIDRKCPYGENSNATFLSYFPTMHHAIQFLDQLMHNLSFRYSIDSLNSIGVCNVNFSQILPFGKKRTKLKVKLSKFCCQQQQQQFSAVTEDENWICLSLAARLELSFVCWYSTVYENGPKCLTLVFQKNLQINHFWHFSWTLVHSKM